MFINIGEFAPDADTTLGVITNILNADGTSKGYKGSPTASSVGVATLAAACTGAVLVKSIDSTTHIFAGTASKLYKLGTTTWTDVSRVANYSSANKWRFAQFGSYTVAVNKSDATQYYLHGTSTVFADLANTPKANIVFTVNDFVFLLGTSEAIYGDQADRWWSSALGNVTNWIPDIATQCVTGRLYDSPGVITAGARLADYAVVFKEKAIYLGSYAGPPTVWNWIRVSDTIGTSSHESVQNIGQAILFANKDGFYSFDGTQIQNIASGKIGEWFRKRLDSNNAGKIVSIVDRNEKIVRWWFPVSGSTGALNAWVSYHWPSGKWGYGESTIEATLDYASPAMDYDALAARYSTYADLPNVGYDATMFLGGTESPAVFNSSHILCSLNGASSSSMIHTGDFGNDGNMSLVSRIRPRYLHPADNATLTNYYTDQLGSTLTTGVTTTEVSGKFDFLQSARWHRVKLETSGDYEITGADVTMSYASDE